MTHEKQEMPEELSDEGREQLANRIRALGTAYRILIVVGLLLLGATVVVLIFTSFLSRWWLLLPVILILLGIILARLEYRLYRQS